MAPSVVDANGNSSANGQVKSEEFTYPEMATPYRVLDQYHSKPTKLRVAGIGAGASGLCLAYKMVGFLCPDVI